MADTLKLSVPGKSEYVSTVRLAVSSVAAKSGFDIEAIEDIKVAVSEACTNILCHSNLDEGQLYIVECTLHDDKIEIVVEDEGEGFDLEGYEEPEPGCVQAGGLGIYIIRALMDDVKVSSSKGSGTRISMIKSVSADVPIMPDATV
jgi:serine/threonine-protein kinase RsbW